ncbi:MAG: hypothetical protein ABI945_09765, partial [Nitrospirales bacterium]
AGVAIGYLRLFHPSVMVMESLSLVMVPAIVSWLATSRRLRRHTQGREAVIQEQVKFVEVRHEELRETYVDQE